MATSNKNSDSDLVKLVRELETKRAAKAEVQKDLQRIADDLQKVAKYYESEVAKLQALRKAANRELKVANVNLANVEEVAREHGLLGSECCEMKTATASYYNEYVKRALGY